MAGLIRAIQDLELAFFGRGSSFRLGFTSDAEVISDPEVTSDAEVSPNPEVTSDAEVVKPDVEVVFLR